MTQPNRKLSGLPLPTTALLSLLCAWAALGLAASIWPKVLFIWQMTGMLLGLVALADLIQVLCPNPFKIERHTKESLAVGNWKKVVVRIENPMARAWTLRCIDHVPGDFQTRHLEHRHRIPKMGYLEFSYTLRPTRRGERQLGPFQLRIQSPLALWQSDAKYPLFTSLKVYPDFAALAHYALMATDHRLSSLGILRKARRGEGMDFHQLREYRTGDSLRSIDWKASARTTKLISREYQDERDQQVVFLLDCGRRMRDLDSSDLNQELSHFDQALNAMFLLAYVALKQGDAVGVATFAEGEPRMLAPRKGLPALNNLYHQLFDLEPSLLASDYLEAAQTLRNRLHKRSLIIVLSNLRDESDEALIPALQLLRQKHLVLFANLREAVIDDILSKEPAHFDQALLQASALDWMARRETLVKKLLHAGLHLVDAPPETLSRALVNRYLELKSAGVF